MSEKNKSLWAHYKKCSFWQRGLIVGTFLFAAYCVIGFLAVPYLITLILPGKLSAALNRQVFIEKVSINPLLLSVEVNELEIRNLQGDDTFIGLHSLFLDFQISSLFKFAPVVKTCQLSGFEVRGSRITDSTYDFSDLLESGKDQGKEDVSSEEKKPFLFSVNNIEISDSAVYFYDAPYDTLHEIEEINLSIPFISNLPSEVQIDVEPSFSAFINGKFFASTGQTRPFVGSKETALQVELHDIALPYYLAYVPVDLGMDIRKAFLDCRLVLSYSQDSTQEKIFGLEGEIALRDIEIALQDGSPLFSLPRLTLQIAPDNLLDGKPHLKSVELDSPVISLYKTKDGTLAIPVVGGSNEVAVEEPQPEQAVEHTPFDIRIDATRVRNGSFRFIDQAVDASITGDQLSLFIKDFSLSEKNQSDLTVGARINSSGLLEVSGELGINPIRGSFTLNFAGFEVGSLQQYVDQYLQLLITDGKFNLMAQADLAMDENGVNGHFSGSSSLENFVAVESGSGNPFCSWKKLKVEEVQGAFPEASVQVGQILLDGLATHIAIDQNGSVNVQKMVKDTGEKEELDHAEEPLVEGQKEVGPARDISIGKIMVKKGEISFTDNRMTPDYHSKLHELNASVTGLSTSVPADFTLKGKLDNTTELDISGTLQPLAITKSGAVQVKLDGIELSQLTPYSGKYIGRRIRKGKLSVNMDYTVDDQEIAGKNILFFDQLALGDSVDSQDAVSLPLDLAVALMQNRKGEINLNVPVQGSLSDPDFSIGGIVVRVIMNMIVKAATSPFALIGALIGSDEQLDHIVFEPGSAILDPSEADKLEKLATVLYDRPGLKISLAGYADPDFDSKAIHETLFWQQLKVRKLEEMVKKGTRGLSLDDITISAEEYEKYLWEAYKTAPFEKEKNFIGMVKKILPADQEKMLRAFLEVGDEQLTLLASQRASAVSYFLVEKKQIEPERVFLTEEQGGQRVKLLLRAVLFVWR